jgi:hypothetical protein
VPHLQAVLHGRQAVVNHFHYFFCFRLCTFVVRFVPLQALFEALLHGHQAGVNHFHYFFSLFFAGALALANARLPDRSIIYAIYYRGMQRPSTSFITFFAVLEPARGPREFHLPSYAYPLGAGRWIFRGIELFLKGFSVRIVSQPASNG